MVGAQGTLCGHPVASYLLVHLSHEFLELYAELRSLAPMSPDGQGPAPLFLVPNDNDAGYLLQLRIPYLALHRPIAQVELHAITEVEQPVMDLLGLLGIVLLEGDDADLHGGEPQRQVAVKVLQ